MADSGDSGKAEAGDIPSPQPRWAKHVFVAGIVVGLVLVGGGVMVQWLAFGPPRVPWIIIYAGLGILLGAFGSAAFVKNQGVMIAGAGAITVILYLLAPENGPTHLKIALAPVPANMTASLYGDHEIASSRVKTKSNQYEFIIIDQMIRSPYLALILTREDKSETIFECLPSNLVASRLGGGRTVQWQVSTDQTALWVDGRPYNEGPCGAPLVTEASSMQVGSLFVSSAMAQEAQVETIPDQTIEAFLEELTAEDAALRREARIGLAQWGEAAVKPMLEYWGADAEDYRKTLGVSVALAGYLRESKDDAKAISTLLSDDDLGLLTKAALHDDRTVRIYATEFLYDLGDARVVDPLVETFPNVSQDAQYQAIFVLGNAVDQLTIPEKQELGATLTQYQLLPSVGPNTKEAIGELVGKLGLK